MGERAKTGRERLAEALKESEESYRALIDDLPELICRSSPGLTRLYVNEGYCRYFGKDREELLGTSFLSELPREDHAALKEHLASLTPEDPVGTFEHRVWRWDGEVRWQQWTNRALFGEGDKHLGYQAVGRDFNVRKLAEEALKESEERFRSLTDAAFEGIAICEDGTVLETNRSFVDLFGYGLEEVRGGALLGFLAPETQDAARGALYSPTGEPCEATGVRKDGSTFALEVRGRTASYKGRDVLVAVVRDVSERAEARRELEESEQRFRSLVRNASDLTTVVDAEGTILYESPSKDRILGYGPEELVGRNVLEPVHPEDLGRVSRVFAAAAARPGTLTAPVELRYRHADGSWRWLEAVANNLLDDPAVGGVVINSRNITGRKRSEKRLREAEERYRTLVERIPAVTYVQQPEPPNAVTFVSPQMKDLLGYSPEECTSDPDQWSRTLHPEDRQRVLAEDRRTDETGAPFSVEYRQLHKDGSVVWVRDEATLVRDEGGRPLYWLGVKVDVSGRKEAEARLVEAEERYRTLVEGVPAVTYTFRQEPGGTSRTAYISPQVRSVLGYTQEEYTSDPDLWQEILHPDDRERVLAEDVRSGQTGETFRAEFRMLAKDGAVVWLREEGRLVRREEDGTQIWHGVMYDITELKRVEEALKNSEERYRALVENIPAVVYIDDVDEANSVIYRSPHVREVLGYEPDEFRSHPEFWQDLLHPEDRERVLRENERTNRTGEPFRIEYRMIRKDGRAVWLRDEAVLIRDEDGVPLFWQGYFADITARKEAEARLVEAEERYRSLVEQIPVATYTRTVERGGGIAYASPQIETITGYAAAEWVADSDLWERVLHPEDRERVVAEDRRTDETGEPFKDEYRVLAPDGSEVWIRDEAVLVEDGEGGPLLWQGVFSDVTERKRAEEALRESEERFRALVQNASDMISILDPDGTIRYVSPSVERVLGFRPEDRVGANAFGEETHPDDVEGVRGAFTRGLGHPGGTSETLEFRVRRRDGSWRYLEAVAANRLDHPAVRGIVVNARDVTERKAYEERLAYQATHDPLTGLPNRRLLMDRLRGALARAERRGRRVAMLYLDLDDFKVVNDSLGHEAGDRLLVAVARRLEGCLRPGDTAARIGGDEFVVLLEDVANADEAARVAERILGALAGRPFPLRGHELYAVPSVGISLDGDGQQPGTMLREADTAMYRAKEEKAGYRVFEPGMDVSVMERLTLEGDLRRAIADGGFGVHYQPQVDLRTGEALAFEALLRWEHPERGPVPPEKVVSVAERAGLIEPLGLWVLEEACRRVKGWRKTPGDGPLVCVNLSARQLRRPELAGDVAAVLERVGLEPEALVLEVTESAAVDDSASAAAMLRALKEKGVRLAMDDFGTGHSSLAQLARFPFDFLKIDRSLVADVDRDPGKAAVVSAAVGLAHTLGMRTVAEGVERTGEHEKVRELGCDIGQGLYWSAPLPGGAHG